MKKMDIVYEDKELLVVNKEPNYLTIATDKEKFKTLYHEASTYVKIPWYREYNMLNYCRLWGLYNPQTIKQGECAIWNSIRKSLSNLCLLDFHTSWNAEKFSVFKDLQAFAEKTDVS